MARRGPVRALPDGAYELRLDAAERDALRRLGAELAGLIEGGDSSVARLFPAAHPDDPQANAEYERLVRGELVAGRIEALRTVDRTVGARRLDEAQLEAWCSALNDLRLVLGERLGVTEDLYERGIDPGDPRAPELALYAWLSWLQEHVVGALASRFPS